MTTGANFDPGAARELAQADAVNEMYELAKTWVGRPDTSMPSECDTAFLVAELRGVPVEIIATVEAPDPEQGPDPSWAVAELRVKPQGYQEPLVMVDPSGAFSIAIKMSDEPEPPLKPKFYEIYEWTPGELQITDNDSTYRDSPLPFPGIYDDDAQALLAALRTAKPDHERMERLRRYDERAAAPKKPPEVPFWRRGVLGSLIDRVVSRGR